MIAKYGLLLGALIALIIPAQITLAETVDVEPLDNIAVLDMNRILKQADAAKSIQEQLQSYRSELQEEFADYERKLRKQEKDIIDQRSQMSAEEFEQKKEKFEKELLETRQLAQKRRSALEKSFRQAVDKLQSHVRDIVKEMADREGYAMILARQNVILVANENEITNEVLEKLNDKVSEINVAKPEM